MKIIEDLKSDYKNFIDCLKEKPQLAEIIKSNRINFVILLVMINYYCIHCFVFPSTFAAKGLFDDGFISIITCGVILCTQVIIFLQIFKVDDWKTKTGLILLAYILEIYLLREADFHRMFTEINVTKGKFFMSSKIPIHQKIFGGMVLFPTFGIFGYLIIFYALPVLKSFKKGRPWAVAFAFWGVLLLCSQILDRTRINKSSSWRVQAIEEIMELAASLYAFTAAFLYTRYGQFKTICARKKTDNEQK